MKAWRQVALVWILVLGPSPAGRSRSTTSRPRGTTASLPVTPTGRWCRTPIHPSSGWATIGRGSAGTQNNGNHELRPDHAAANADCQPLSPPRPSAQHPVRLRERASDNGHGTEPTGNASATRPIRPTWPQRSSAARSRKAQGSRLTRSSSRVTIRAPTRATTCCPTARRRRSAGTRSTRSIRAPDMIGASALSLPIPPTTCSYLYDTTTPDRTQLNSGDSGSPSFIVTGSPGVMYLAGAHYADCDAGYSGWDYVPAHVVADPR